MIIKLNNNTEVKKHQLTCVEHYTGQLSDYTVHSKHIIVI